jgi:hypothetical protein
VAPQATKSSSDDRLDPSSEVSSRARNTLSFSTSYALQHE